MALSEFAEGSTILVDKPLGWTSFDVVNKIRWNLKQKLGVKKIKVGHGGTLDPLATGLLIVCIGKHTKRIDQIMPGEKVYSGKFLLGKTTPSYDLETEFADIKSTENIEESQIEEIRKSFIGEQDQIPPLFSAKQIDGKRAYEHARLGSDIQLKANKVEISELEIDSSNYPEISFKMTCSKGTYVRSLAHDFGQKLGCGATLIELRRLKSGDFSITESKSVDEWIEFIQESSL